MSASDVTPAPSTASEARRPARAALAMLILAGLVWHALLVRETLARVEGSDLVRQWVVCRYLEAGQDPWAISRAVLERAAGDASGAPRPVSRMPRDAELARTNPVAALHGPPEATYSPSAVGLLSVSFGLLPSPALAHAAWMVVNLLALHLAALLLGEHFFPRRPGGALTRAAPAYALLFALLPAALAVRSGQVSLVVLAGLLLAARRATPAPLAGLGLAVALVKPTIALPFLVLPLIQRRWGVLACAAAVHAASFLAVSWSMGRDPVALTGDWLAVGGHFFWGMYTVHEVIVSLGLAGTAVDVAVRIALLGAIAGLTLARRDAPLPVLFGFLSVASLAWVYHLGYDFVLLSPALLLPFAQSGPGAPGRRLAWVVLALLLAAAAVGFHPAIVQGRTPLMKALRWPMRVAMGWMLVDATRRLIAASPECAFMTNRQDAKTPRDARRS